MSNEAPAAAPKKGKMGMLVVIVTALLATGGGAAVPFFLHAKEEPTKKAHVEEHKAKPMVITFGEILVNLDEDRSTRYLKVKILLVVDEKDEKDVNQVMAKQKAFLKNWLLAHLSDQAPQDVAKRAGYNRMRREIREQFNAIMYPDGPEKIQEVLFDEFQVQ